MCRTFCSTSDSILGRCFRRLTRSVFIRWPILSHSSIGCAGNLAVQPRFVCSVVSEPVNLSRLIEEWLDDLSALPDSPDVKIEKEIPPQLYVAGEKRYTSLIVQNLLENARKYNRKGGCIRVTAHAQDGEILLNIGNT